MIFSGILDMYVMLNSYEIMVRNHSKSYENYKEGSATLNKWYQMQQKGYEI